MPDFKYAPMFQLGEDTTEYYKIPGSEKLVSTADFENSRVGEAGLYGRFRGLQNAQSEP